eukprot:1659742-Pleurochrysis_carterae.AAC.2
MDEITLAAVSTAGSTATSAPQICTHTQVDEGGTHPVRAGNGGRRLKCCRQNAAVSARRPPDR